MRLSKIATGVVLVLLAAAAASAQVSTEWAKDVDFSKYKTFTWIMDPNASNPLINQRIISHVNAARTSKGLRLTTGEADLGIAANAATEEQQTLETLYDGFAGGWRYDGVGTATTTVHTYTVGTLIIDIFDVRTKAAVWRGTAMKTLSSNPEKRANTVDKAIATMFKGFPVANPTRSAEGLSPGSRR